MPNAGFIVNTQTCRDCACIWDRIGNVWNNNGSHACITVPYFGTEQNTGMLFCSGSHTYYEKLRIAWITYAAETMASMRNKAIPEHGQPPNNDMCLRISVICVCALKAAIIIKGNLFIVKCACVYGNDTGHFYIEPKFQFIYHVLLHIQLESHFLWLREDRFVVRAHLMVSIKIKGDTNCSQTDKLVIAKRTS